MIKLALLEINRQEVNTEREKGNEKAKIIIRIIKVQSLI
jgi:hypothetical protein